MGMNHAEIERVTSEIAGLCGSFLAEVRQPLRDRLVLVFSTGERLVMVPRGSCARVHLSLQRLSSPKQPYSFQGACRAHLGGRLLEVRKADGDRVLDLVFTHGQLHLRLTGRGGGLWLCDGDRVVSAYDGPSHSGLPPLPCPQPDLRSPRFAPAADQSWNQAAAHYFEEQEAEDELGALRAGVERRLRTERARLQRLARALQADLDAADGAPTLRRTADALAANLHALPRHVAQLMVSDLEDERVVHTVQLTKGESPVQAMERLYRRASKLDRGVDRVLEQLERTETKLEELTQTLATCATAQREALERLQQDAPPQRAASAQAPRSPWRTWAGPGGQQLHVGRDEAGNRRLSFQQARGDDIWFHVRGTPGPHALLPLAKGTTPPLDLLLAAAAIVAMASGVRVGERADIQYTEARHVRPVPGSPGARVYVSHERVLSIERAAEAPPGWTRVV